MKTTNLTNEQLQQLQSEQVPAEEKREQVTQELLDRLENLQAALSVCRPYMKHWPNTTEFDSAEWQAVRFRDEKEEAFRKRIASVCRFILDTAEDTLVFIRAYHKLESTDAALARVQSWLSGIIGDAAKCLTKDGWMVAEGVTQEGLPQLPEVLLRYLQELEKSLVADRKAQIRQDGSLEARSPEVRNAPN